jgi:hypothetical protein
VKKCFVDHRLRRVAAGRYGGGSAFLLSLADRRRNLRQVRIRQRVYLSVKSDTLAPPEISELLGLAPTEAKAMGSSDPVRGTPRCHLWSLASGVGQAAPLCDHFDALLPILRSHEEALRVVSRHASTIIDLVVVRYFDDGEEEFDEATYGLNPDEGVVRLSGQHPFLGWALESADIDLLSACGVGLDIDEYG